MRNPEKVSARRARLLGERPGAFAEAKHLRMSASKVRRVIDMVRGEDAMTALAILRYAPQAAAVPARKALQSAIANAEQQEGLEAEDLYVSAIFADEGTTLRRIRPRAKGSASRILKRGAHLTVVVEPRPDLLPEIETPTRRPVAASARAAVPAAKKPAAAKPAAKPAKEDAPAKPAAKPAKEEAPAKPARTRAKKTEAEPAEDVKPATKAPAKASPEPTEAAPKTPRASRTKATTDETTKEA